MTIELDSTLAQAEVLYLSFAQVVADIDRRQAERDASGPGQDGLRRRPTASKSSSTPPTAAESLNDVEMPLISEYLRELLISGRSHARYQNPVALTAGAASSSA